MNIKSAIVGLCLLAVPTAANAAYVSIAFSTDTGAWATSGTQPDEQSAWSAAMNGCRARAGGRQEGCRIVMTTHGAYCGALVIHRPTSAGGTWGWGSGSGPDEGLASAAAWRSCNSMQSQSRCDELVTTVCSR